MGDRSCLDCFRTFLRIILIIVNIAVTLLGFLILVVGIWSKVEGKDYLQITDNDKAYAQIPILLIVVGIFVLLLGVVGVIGAVFANTIGGRIILGLYGFVLALLVIIEVAGGIAAGVERGRLGSSLQGSINQTFSNYNDTNSNYKETWDFVQSKFQCCGTTSYQSYRAVLNINPPTSCCTSAAGSDCDTTETGNINEEGCTSKIEKNIKAILGVVAGVAITFGFLQIIGVVVSCFVAIAGRREENKYQVV